MNTATYDSNITGLLVVDPYNDFISEGGKIWPRIKAVAEANDCVSNMLKVLNAARAAKLRASFMPCTTDIVQATTKRGRTSRRSNEARGSARLSNTALGVASSVPNLRRCQVRSSHRNTGVPAGLLTLIWTCNSRSTASIGSL